jgi:methyl coenzyme M reductase subunit C-like uncharacterized protein (methanogenesis marker protein 7)
MIDFTQLRDVSIIVGIVASFGGLSYVYYTNEKVRNIVKKILPFLPMVLGFFAGRIKDEKGVFDLHDFVTLMGRVSERLRATFNDVSNLEFDDVQDEVFAIVSEELKRYREAGVKNVPNVSDATVRQQVKLVFEAIKRVTSENPAGDDSQS